jgi:hypothetical protein
MLESRRLRAGIASLGALPTATLRSTQARPLGGVAQLDHGHDVQHRLTCRLPTRDSRVPDVVAAGVVDGRGAVPGGEGARPGNLVMSPASISSRIAPDGPIPCRLAGVVPVAASRWPSSGPRPWRASKRTRGRSSVRRPPACGPCLRHRADGPGPAASWPGPRTGLSSPRRGRARAAAGASGRSSGCGPHPEPGVGRPGPVAPSAAGRRPLPAAGRPCGDRRNRVCVGRVGLAALAGGEHLRPRQQPGRHVHHPLGIGERPTASYGRRLGGSIALFPWPAPGFREHGPVRSNVGGIPPTAQDLLISAHDLNRGGALMRIHPDDHPAHASVVLSALVTAERAGHCYFEQANSLEPLLAPCGTRPRRL